MASTTPLYQIVHATDPYDSTIEKFNVRVMQGPISETVLYEIIVILAVLLVVALIAIGVLVYWAFFRKRYPNAPQYQAVRMTEIERREALNQ
ncbi:hypothetical protein PRIPAC_87341 [Pristionchus pacificus]|uniref:Uncharacterized protein n=1 Tax=Pristionchus pacificus TaxID=54126 RepID=A0A454XWB2_PRIPA|nr:hypothetical protein PRIPAC_87341 [Pristionchus pacificus]|eukprot:PDM82571.1 hypothetical protein PRIPAC_36964 [Pristionchus pacificus]